ncbi:hypothetical protein MKZ38_001782 [Zalerion maritima]|uniref:Uncharacterized protein n=1 Tax=Zalerion maritima TaxID=339359 RepID=A0AAD5RXP5_9PEZI|nr:hypothetical protein MKZ38_001782 [Zalerion maritima]
MGPHGSPLYKLQPDSSTFNILFNSVEETALLTGTSHPETETETEALEVEIEVTSTVINKMAIVNSVGERPVSVNAAALGEGESDTGTSVGNAPGGGDGTCTGSGVGAGTGGNSAMSRGHSSALWENTMAGAPDDDPV